LGLKKYLKNIPTAQVCLSLFHFIDSSLTMQAIGRIRVNEFEWHKQLTKVWALIQSLQTNCKVKNW